MVAWKRSTTMYQFPWASDNSRQCNLPVADVLGPHEGQAGR
jgi:hypothetical protein